MSGPDESGERDADEVIPSRERKLAELQSRREAGELSPHPFDLNQLTDIMLEGRPLTRSDLTHSTGDQAVVLTLDDLEGCLQYIDFSGRLEIIDSAGRKMHIGPEAIAEGDVLIIYPENLGNEEGKPYVRVVGG